MRTSSKTDKVLSVRLRGKALRDFEELLQETGESPTFYLKTAIQVLVYAYLKKRYERILESLDAREDSQ